MSQKYLDKSEDKRNSKKLLWKSLVYIKDRAFFLKASIEEPFIRINYYDPFLNKKINFKTEKE